jgi:hypothetical protein
MSRKGVVVAAFIAFAGHGAVAAEKVGEAVLIKTTVTGAGGTLVTKSPVHRDERIRTSSSGLGEFIFQDGTKFAIGANSSVVIDKFVFNDSKSVKNLTINAAKGSSLDKRRLSVVGLQDQHAGGDGRDPRHSA